MNKPGEHNNIRTQGSCCSDYGVGWTDKVRFQAGTERFYLLHSVYTSSKAYPAFHPVGTGNFNIGYKATVGYNLQLTLHLVKR